MLVKQLADPADPGYRFQLTAPSWLMERAWEVQLSTACSGWKAFFRSYVVVPICSQVFSTLVSGTAEELFELFDKGLASPFSIRDQSGQTLLHVGQILLKTRAEHATHKMLPCARPRCNTDLTWSSP